MTLGKDHDNWRYGPHWSCVNYAIIDGDRTYVQLEMPEALTDDTDDFGVHPSMLDRAVLLVSERFMRFSLPYSFDGIHIYGSLGSKANAVGKHRMAGQTHVFDARIFDEQGLLAVEVVGYIRREAEEKMASQNPDFARLTTPDNAPFHLSTAEPGNLDTLEMVPLEPRSPGPDQIVIDIACAGLNFRDVLGALGQLDNIEGEHIALGAECSGVVRERGDNVKHFDIGDPVLAMCRQSLASEVTVDVSAVRAMPSDMSFEQAAGIPIPFLTAYYGLNELAQIKAGERVLIHAATGGVGLAAVQIARLVGAEIVATAGREEKRDYLRNIGIEHVFDSRSLDFAAELTELTEGAGVDVILNSLAGEFVPLGLDILAPLGRFVEIGKRDIYADTRIGLAPFKKNIGYFSVDLGVVQHQQPDVFKSLFDDLMDKFYKGTLEPLPVTVFPIQKVSGGFQRMARAEHIGKLVFNINKPQVTQDHPAYQASTLFQFEQRFNKGIPTDLGMETFRRLLSSDLTPSTVIATNFKFDDVSSQMAVLSSTISRARPELDTPYREATTPEEQLLVENWEKFLGVSPVGVDDSFFELGGDSLSAIQIQTIVNSEFNVDLPMDIFLEKPTISGICGALEGLE